MGYPVCIGCIRNSITCLPDPVLILVWGPDMPVVIFRDQAFDDPKSRSARRIWREKEEGPISDTVARDRSGGVQLLQPPRIRSNRNLRTSGLTCRCPGGWGNPGPPRAARRRHRCAGWWISFQGWFFCSHRTVFLLAFVHQPYGSRTIITHMRINHLKDRIVPCSKENHLSEISPALSPKKREIYIISGA
jgi:hypothetical protein